MIGRKRISRKIISGPNSKGEVVDLHSQGDFVFKSQHHGTIRFNFEPLMRHGREKLAGQMRDALWSLRHDVEGNSQTTYNIPCVAAKKLRSSSRPKLTFLYQDGTGREWRAGHTPDLLLD